MQQYTKICPRCNSLFITNHKTTSFCGRSCASSHPRPKWHDQKRIEARFWSNVEKLDNGCWIWKTNKTPNGYGRFYAHNKVASAHRFSYEIHYGFIPDGFDVCHNCPTGDNPSCVRPAHLFLGTRKDNMADCVKKDRQAKWEKHGGAILTVEKVRQIRKLYATGIYSFAALGKMFQVSYSSIGKVVRNITWKDLPI